MNFQSPNFNPQAMPENQEFAGGIMEMLAALKAKQQGGAQAAQGGGGSGILGGAMGGAQLGSMFGPVGMGVGAAAGAGLGYLGSRGGK